MSKALCLMHTPTGYRCGDRPDCARLTSPSQHHPVSAFERYSALNNSYAQQRNLALYLNFPQSCLVQASPENYINALLQEISMLAKVARHQSAIQHLHFTGHCDLFQPQQLARVVQKLHKHFNLRHHNLFNYSVNISPYNTNWGNIGALRELGFNNISLELDTETSCFKQTQTIYEAARTLDYSNICFALNYASPGQQSIQFGQQVKTLSALVPERIQLQRHYSANDKTAGQLFVVASQQLAAAGYVHLGLECFALPDDALVSAAELDLLNSNAQGQASASYFDILGFGVGAKSQIGQLYYQNCPWAQHYLKAIAQNQLPGAIGIKSEIAIL